MVHEWIHKIAPSYIPYLQGQDVIDFQKCLSNIASQLQSKTTYYYQTLFQASGTF